MPQIPTFDNLTLDPAGPPGNAWGLFGDNDLGMLNLLTPETVRRAAAEEIRDGVRFSLDLPLDRIKSPSFGRKAFARELVNKAPRSVNDDVLVFNTQTSSQWDGFRHYGEPVGLGDRISSHITLKTCWLTECRESEAPALFQRQ